MKNQPQNASLEDSLFDLHSSVNRLIRVIHQNAGTLDKGQEILDKLPLLDFYNDDLLRNLNTLKRKV